MFIVLVLRQSRGFVSSYTRPSARTWLGSGCLDTATRCLSHARRLAEFDDMFFDKPSSKPRPRPSRSESTNDDFGGYDYDPMDDDPDDMDISSFIEEEDDAPPQSSAWDATTSSAGDGLVVAGPASPPKIQETESDPPMSILGKLDQPAPLRRVEMMVPLDRDDLYLKTSNGGSMDLTVDQLRERLKELEQKIYAKNDGKKFNINSPKQVALVLFGDTEQSTNKDALEAMGGAGNALAALIVLYRQRKQEITRLERKAAVASNGKTVTAFSKTDTDSHDPLLLVDASAYIFRAYFSMPPLHRTDGMPVGAVMGFCNMLNRLVLTRLLAGERPRLVLVYDASGKNFRHDLYPKYKANRLQRPIDLIPQFDLVREAATAYGIPGMEASGFEADDVIATLATQALSEGIDTHILSGDKDLMQLVTPPGVAPYVHMIDPMSMSRVDHDVVVEKWGVPPEKIGDILALAGDTADNIPGVPGIGPKIAASLLEEYGSLEEIFRHVDGIKQSARREKLIEHQELALLSRKLVELERDIPSDRLNSIPSPMINVIDLRMEPLNGDRLLAFYRTMGFKTLQRQVKDRLEQNEIKTKRPKSTWSQRPKAQIPEPKEYEDVPF
jgi:5'-3' exonuclease